MYICIDWVQDNVAAGWAYDKRSGHRPAGFEILNSTQLLPFQVIDVARPDVASYFGTSDENLGFGLIVNQPFSGWNAVTIADMPYSWDCGYDVNNGFWCGWIGAQVTFTIGD